MNALKPLVIFLLLLAGLLYVFSIVWAGITAYQQKVLDAVFQTPVVIIGGMLSTNLGAVLGITVKPVDGKNPSPTFLRLRSSVQPTRSAAIVGRMDQNQKFQIIACWVYILSLVIASVFLLVVYVKYDKNSVPLLEEQAKTLFGILAGILMVVLGGTKKEGD